MNLGTLGIPSCVTETRSASRPIGFQQKPLCDRPCCRPSQSDCSVVSRKRRISWLDWRSQVKVAGDGYRPFSFFFPPKSWRVNLTLRMRVHTYILQGAAAGASRALTRLHGYIWPGTYQSGQPLQSCCLTMAHRFIIWPPLLYNYHQIYCPLKKQTNKPTVDTSTLLQQKPPLISELQYLIPHHLHWSDFNPFKDMFPSEDHALSFLSSHY